MSDARPEVQPDLPRGPWRAVDVRGYPGTVNIVSDEPDGDCNHTLIASMVPKDGKVARWLLRCGEMFAHGRPEATPTHTCDAVGSDALDEYLACGGCQEERARRGGSEATPVYEPNVGDRVQRVGNGAAGLVADVARNGPYPVIVEWDSGHVSAIEPSKLEPMPTERADDLEIIGGMFEERTNNASGYAELIGDIVEYVQTERRRAEQRRAAAQPEPGRGTNDCIVTGCDWDHAGEYPLCPKHLDLVANHPDEALPEPPQPEVSLASVEKAIRDGKFKSWTGEVSAMARELAAWRDRGTQVVGTDGVRDGVEALLRKLKAGPSSDLCFEMIDALEDCLQMSPGGRPEATPRKWTGPVEAEASVDEAGPVCGPKGDETMKETAHVAYDAYAAHTGGKTFDGRDMPKWHELPERIREAWRAAVAAVTPAS